MSARSCCRRGAEVAGWVVPGATLALLPKCPACVAAYVALATGLGVSFSTAAYIRTSIVIVSVSVMVFVVARRFAVMRSRRARGPVSSAGRVGCNPLKRNVLSRWDGRARTHQGCGGMNEEPDGVERSGRSPNPVRSRHLLPARETAKTVT